MKIFLIAIINLILTSSLALASEKLGEAVCFKENAASIQRGNSSTDYNKSEPVKIDFDERTSRSTIVEVNTFKNVTIFTEEASSEGKKGKESHFSVGTIDKNNNKYTFSDITFPLENMERSEEVHVRQYFYSCFFLE